MWRLWTFTPVAGGTQIEERIHTLAKNPQTIVAARIIFPLLDRLGLFKRMAAVPMLKLKQRLEEMSVT